MRRILSFAIAVIMTFGCLSGISVSFAGEAEADTLVAQSFADVLVGEATNVTFTVKDVPNASELSLVDESGVRVARLFDKGTKGDARKNDGVFSASMTLESDTRKLVKYAIYNGDTKVKDVTVNFYVEFTAADYAEKNEILFGIDEIENAYSEADDNTVTNAVYEYLINNDSVCNVIRENDTQIAYETAAGIPCVFARLSKTTKGSADTDLYSYTNGEFNKMTPSLVTVNSFTNPNVLIVRPFRNFEGEDGFHNDRYLTAANNIAEYTHGSVTVLDDKDTIPFNILENLYMNGFFMVDSHGIKHGSKSYIYVSDGAGYTSADLQAGRAVILGYEHVCISGEYFQAEYEKRGITLENLFCYLGTCSGMEEDTMYRPFIELGAQVIFGYDSSVTFTYEAQMMTKLFARFVTENEENPAYTYTIADSISYAKSSAGSIDPYNGIAVMTIEGNGDFKLKQDLVAHTAFSFAEESGTGFVNNPYYIGVSFEPHNVYGSTQQWSSSNEEVAKIIGPRIVRALSVGTTTISCTVTDIVDGNEVSFTDTFELTVENSYITDISIEISGTNARFDVGQSRQMRVSILPWNASDKTILYSSNNEGTVTVDESGKVSAVAPGTAAVICTARDGGFTKHLNVTVSNAGIYVLVDTIETGSTYVFLGSAAQKAITGKVENGVFAARELVVTGNQLFGNINTQSTWIATVNNDGSFYLKNSNTQKYMSYLDEGSAAVTDEPEAAYTIDQDRKMFIVNPPSEDYAALRLRSAGFSYSKASSAVKISIYKFINFADNEQYSTVTFVDGDTRIATQCVRNGERAVAATPITSETGKTFLGWSIPLNAINGDVTATAIYADEVLDGTYVSFYDSVTNELIGRETVDENGSVTAPDAPIHEGVEFIGWSEELTGITDNMTVFAIYSNEREQGDANNDGLVNTGDAVHILRYTVGLITMSEADIAIADMNEDGQTNTGDAVAILRKVVGL